MESDEPEIEFDENAKQPEDVKLITKFDKLNEDFESTVYIGQGKLINDEWTPHGVGIKVTKDYQDSSVNYWLDTFEDGTL